jgi:serine/threonine protein kinase
MANIKRICSPEQFCGENVTTATDIYSSRVTLYELLTGNLPYETFRAHTSA